MEKFFEILGSDCAQSIIAITNIFTFILMAIIAGKIQKEISNQQLKNEERKSIREIRMESIKALDSKIEHFIGVKNIQSSTPVEEIKVNILKIDVVIDSFFKTNSIFFDETVTRFYSKSIKELENLVDEKQLIDKAKITSILAGAQVDSESFIKDLYEYTNEKIKNEY